MSITSRRQILTSAGVSAGIDMALYLVERQVSIERAHVVQHDILYDDGPYPVLGGSRRTTLPPTTARPASAHSHT